MRTLFPTLILPRPFWIWPVLRFRRNMQGRSLVPVIQGNTPEDWRKSFYYQYYEFPGAHSVARHYGVTNGKYKLIHFYGPSHIENETYDEWELFDLDSGPK